MTIQMSISTATIAFFIKVLVLKFVSYFNIIKCVFWHIFFLNMNKHGFSTSFTKIISLNLIYLVGQNLA